MDSWFRLRHLQSVSCRNVNITIKDLNCNSIFFALSTTDKENLGYFYQSSKCENLLNPCWENVDLSYENIRSFSFLDNFLITFFLNKKNKNKILVEIIIHISGLSLFNKPTNSEDDSEKFLFQLNNNWYSFDLLDNQNLPLPTSNDFSVKIKKKLYNIETIKRFFYLITDNEQQNIEQNLLTRRKTTENQIYHHRTRILQINQKKNRIIAINNQISMEKKIQKLKLKELDELKKSVNLLKQKVNKTLENKKRTEMDISKQSTNLKRYRDVYLKISNDYMLRMYQLISELSKIFPISPTDILPTTTDQSNNTITIHSDDKLSICNLHLPNNDRQMTLNLDNTLFAALGMVCQLLNALSKIYDIPLRYPLILDDPKIAIRNNIIDMDDSERNFLLVKSTAPSYKFQYAIYLLNLDIAAIRGYFSLSTKWPDRTLWNINTIIDRKTRAVDNNSTNMGSNNNLMHSTLTVSSNCLSSSTNSPHYLVSPQDMSPLVTKSFSGIN